MSIINILIHLRSWPDNEGCPLVGVALQEMPYCITFEFLYAVL